MHTNNIIFFTLLGISKSIEFIFLIYFIIYHYNELVTNTNTMYISLMSIIVFYMFNIYALLFTVVKDPGIVAPRAYGSYDLIDIELVDGTVIHVNVEEDRREVYIKYNTDIYNSNIYNSNIYNSNILKNTDIYNTNIFNTNILYTKYENIKIINNTNINNIINSNINILNNNTLSNNTTCNDNKDNTNILCNNKTSNDNNNILCNYNIIMFYQSYCSICNHFKPTGTSHCYLCGYCIMDKDHHCMMLNTCIGRNNTKCYFYYILSELVENILLLVLFNIHAHRCIFSDKLKKYKNIINNTKYNNIINNTKYNNTYNTNKYNYKYYIFLLFIKYTCIVFSKLFIIIVLYNLYICVKFYYFALMDVKARDYYIKKKRGRFSIRSVVKRILTFRSAV